MWKDPETAVDRTPMRTQFVLLETYTKTSHLWRYLLECRGCRQRYFFEFHEEIDWDGGEDPQFSAWVPVETDYQVAALRAAEPGHLSPFVPRLCKDWPKGQKRPRLHWVVGDPKAMPETPR